MQSIGVFLGIIGGNVAGNMAASYSPANASIIKPATKGGLGLLVHYFKGHVPAQFRSIADGVAVGALASAFVDVSKMVLPASIQAQLGSYGAFGDVQYVPVSGIEYSELSGAENDFASMDDNVFAQPMSEF